MQHLLGDTEENHKKSQSH